MTNGYVTPRCSYCRDGALPHAAISIQRPGVPMRQCPRCGKRYHDARYIEPALAFYNKNQPELGPLWTAIVLCIAVAKPLVNYVRAYAAPHTEFACAISLGLIGLLLAVYLYHILFRRFAKNAYYKRFERKKLACLSGRGGLSPKRRSSLRRLSQEDYLYELLANGVMIPLFFFKRISAAPDPRRIQDAMEAYAEKRQRLEEELLNRQEELQQQKTEQKRKDLRDEAEYYRYCLSLDPGDRKLRQQAAQRNMSPQAFQAYCKTNLAKLQDDFYAL